MKVTSICYLLVSLCLIVLHNYSLAAEHQGVSSYKLPRYHGYNDDLSRGLPGSASALRWTSRKIRPMFETVRQFPWKNCIYYFDVYGGPGSPWLEVRNGNSEFAHSEGIDVYILNVIYTDVNNDGVDEAALFTEIWDGSQLHTNIGIFSLDTDQRDFAYLVGVIPGAISYYRNGTHIKSISLVNSELTVRRYAKRDGEKTYYRVEKWGWDGKKMIQDETRLRIETEEKK